MSSNVLYPALKQLALGGQVIADEFDARVDDLFFDHLFATLAMSDDEARLAFDERVREIAWGELQRAIDRCSVADARRFRAICDAEGMFKGCLKKNFPDLTAAEARAEGASS